MRSLCTLLYNCNSLQVKCKCDKTSPNCFVSIYPAHSWWYVNVLFRSILHLRDQKPQANLDLIKQKNSSSSKPKTHSNKICLLSPTAIRRGPTTLAAIAVLHICSLHAQLLAPPLGALHVEIFGSDSQILWRESSVKAAQGPEVTLHNSKHQ